MPKFSRVTLSVLALALFCSPAAIAAQELVIKTDQTQLIDVTGNPGTVVIGNPSIADATVQGNKIFVHGRAFGSTNLIILDQNGNQIAALDITVQLGGENNLAIYKAGVRYSYVCAPNCEATLQAGDQVDWFGDIVKMNNTKSAAASSRRSGEAAPPVAQ